MEIIALFLICFTASLIHNSTGFGFGIIAMTALPFFIPFKEAAVITVVLGAVISVQSILLLKKHVNMKIIFMPFLSYFAISTLGVYLVIAVSDFILKRILGVLLLMLAVYFALCHKKLKIAPNIKNGIIAGVLGGVPGGMFAMGGPPMAAYYFFAAKNNLEYKTSLDFIFAVAGIYNVFLHVFYGSFNAQIIKLSVIGIIATAIGGLLGLKIFRMLNRDSLSKCIYVLIFLMGIVLIIKG